MICFKMLAVNCCQMLSDVVLVVICYDSCLGCLGCQESINDYY